MKKETRESVQVASAVAMLAGGFSLSVAGFLTPPVGQIHESVLGLFAECLVYAGSIFGVTIYIQSKYNEIRNYVEKKMEDSKNEKN
ncbi:hypothetical protein [uncultured Prevotella sp.]|uniref:hypothetical protein n=1 Tax=uncultured Prevotella sp. TaxID=159272 RepID=UPI00261F3195|nr:hypothetical protein [uncultured Prevotella sp.]